MPLDEKAEIFYFLSKIKNELSIIENSVLAADAMEVNFTRKRDSKE
jgi:hypothetical protein